MTTHRYRPSADMSLLVEMGFDRPLNRLFLTIYRNPNTDQEVFLYNCLDDPQRSTFTDNLVPKTTLLAYYCDVVARFGNGKWDIPDQMKLNILEDAFVCRGNQTTIYEDDL
ncbi:MAG: hypothetical protein VW270_21210 [Candidatus Poseidoniales archaeon]